MSTERERLIKWAKQLADPNWCLSVPKEAKDTISALVKELEPRTITDHYADNGTETLKVGTAVVSGGETLVAQSDGTWADQCGSTWDFWELELPILVVHEVTA